jgi:Flp pilus assembly protein TadG
MARRIKVDLNRVGRQFARLRALVSIFRFNKRGNVAIIFAVSAVPLIGAIGCVVDYSMAAMIKTKLQAAADQASLAAVSLNSTPMTTATNMTGNGTVSGGATYATNFFNANLTTTTGYSNLTPTATVTKSGTTITSKVSFTANVPTLFMGVMGFHNVAISGTSTSSYTLPTYINFYLMLDVSGSMGFPSTSSEQTRLEAANPDNKDVYPGGCTFACHFSAQGSCDAPVTSAPAGSPSNWSQYCQGYIVSRNGANYHNTPVTSCPTAGTSACIQLQADAVGYAVQQLLSTAASAEVVTNQYQVGLYPFIRYLYSYFPLTSNLSGSSTNSSTINYAAANLANLLDTGANSNLGSGGTHFENAFPSMNTIISSVGDGSSGSSPLPYVFLITDGAQDSQVQWSGSWSGSNNATVIDTSYCTTLKNRGITIAVLYVPYQPIQNPTTIYNNEDGAINAIIPNIPTALQSCASPNFFFTASSPTAITNTMITMFEQVVNTAHISQ